MTRSPEQQFAFARTLPVDELVKVMQGQSDVVDMSIAHMMLRQKMPMIKAQQGAQAAQVAQGPSVAQKDVAEAKQIAQPQMEQGVAALPADVDVPEYAGGGIVAFTGGGQASLPFASSIGSPLQSNIKPGPGPTFSSAFPDIAAAEKAAAEAAAQSGGRISFTAALKRILGPAYGIYELAKFHKTGMDYDTGMGFGTPEEQMTVGTIMQSPRERPVNVAAAVTPNAPAAPGATPPAQEAPPTPVATKPASENAGLGALSKQIETLRERLTKPTLAGSSAEVEELYKQAGVNTDPYAEYKKALAEEKSKSSEDRREAGWMRALEAGLGIMGGESPYAFTNIGKGAQAAAKGALEDTKEFRKLEREREKSLASIAVAENDLKRGITDKKIARYDDALQRYNSADMKLSELQIGVDLEKAKIGTTKALKIDEVALKEANDQIQKEMVTNPLLAQDPVKYRQRLTDLFSGFRSALMGQGISQPSTAPRGRVVNGVYVPAGR